MKAVKIHLRAVAPGPRPRGDPGAAGGGEGFGRRRWAILALLLSAPALAHTGMPGVSALSLRAPFSFVAMRAIVAGSDGRPAMGRVDFSPWRGKALAFLVFDPGLPADLAQVRRFEALARRLHSTGCFLVAVPRRSINRPFMFRTFAQEHFTLPFLIDDRDAFPFAFGFPIEASPRYELFDRNWALTVENGRSADERFPTGLTVAKAIRELDEGRPVEPVRVPPPGRPR